MQPDALTISYLSLQSPVLKLGTNKTWCGRNKDAVRKPKLTYYAKSMSVDYPNDLNLDRCTSCYFASCPANSQDASEIRASRRPNCMQQILAKHGS